LSAGRRLDRLSAQLTCPQCAAREREPGTPDEARRRVAELRDELQERWEHRATGAEVAGRADALRADARRLDTMAAERG